MGNLIRENLPDPVAYFESEGLKLTGKGKWRNTDAERKASEVRLRAERRTGELLKDLARATAPNPQGSNQHKEVTPNDAEQPTPSPYASALQQTGISTQTASRYQALANIRARAALAGVQIHVFDDECTGKTIFVVSRWAMTRQLESLHALEEWLSMVLGSRK